MECVPIIIPILDSEITSPSVSVVSDVGCVSTLGVQEQPQTAQSGVRPLLLLCIRGECSQRPPVQVFSLAGNPHTTRIAGTLVDFEQHGPLLRLCPRNDQPYAPADAGKSDQCAQFLYAVAHHRLFLLH